jgi:hypothetical protein
MDSTALTKMTETEMMARVNLARFPQELTVVDKKMLAAAAISYGFDPLMGEISIYQSRPFVSIDGRYRKAQETGRLDGVETRPATKQEREDWQIPEGDYFFRSEVWLVGSNRPFVGWGRVRAIETTGGKGFKPVETNPQRMAEKRAEAQALRKAFSIPLPSIEDIGSQDNDPNVIDTTAHVVVEAVEVEPKPTVKPEPAPKKQTPKEKVEATPEPVEEEQHGVTVDLDWLREALENLQWTEVGDYLKKAYGVTGKRVSELVNALDDEQKAEFVSEVQQRLDNQ